MSDPVPAAVPPADAVAAPTPSPPSLADRLKKCVTVVHGLKADNPNGQAAKDMQFLFAELLDLMQLAQANKL